MKGSLHLHSMLQFNKKLFASMTFSILGQISKFFLELENSHSYSVFAEPDIPWKYCSLCMYIVQAIKTLGMLLIK